MPLKGYKQTDDHKAKKSAYPSPLKGRKQSAEHIENKVAPQRGVRKYPNGRIFSPEHRAKINSALKKNPRVSKFKERHHRWKGGKKIQKNGYVLLYDREHPSGQIYILEHRLVMEKFLGRTLYEGENIHHINGIRNDNRLKNLELWIKPHPPGIRVADAIKWAYEIINRYKK